MKDMKDNKEFESHLISLYESALNEADDKKESPEVEKFKDSTVKNPKTGNKVKVSTVLKDPDNPLHDKVKGELEKVKAKAEGSKEDEEEDDDNPEENIKALTKNIEDERVAIEASKNKIKDLEKQKKASTDPGSFDKAIQKEKTRIEQGEEDIREMKAKKEAEKKKISSAPSEPKKPEATKPESTEEKPATGEKPEGEKPEATEENPEGKTSEEEKDKDKAKIESLKKEIDKLESVYDSKKEASQNRYQSLAEKTDSLATNGLLEEFVRKERARAKAEFNEKILSFLVDAGQKDEIKERIKEETERANKIENELAQAQKKADEKNADDPKYQEAKEKTAGPESEDKPEEKNPTKKDSESTDKGDEKSKSPEELAKEQKKKEIDYNLGVLTSKLEKVKAAHDKAKADGKDMKVLSAISKNYQEMKKAIEKLKTEKEKLGESFDSIELEIWALDVALTTLLEQIETGYLFE